MPRELVMMMATTMHHCSFWLVDVDPSISAVVPHFTELTSFLALRNAHDYAPETSPACQTLVTHIIKREQDVRITKGNGTWSFEGNDKRCPSWPRCLQNRWRKPLCSEAPGVRSRSALKKNVDYILSHHNRVAAKPLDLIGQCLPC